MRPSLLLNRSRVITMALLIGTLASTLGWAVIPDAAPDLPVLVSATPAGNIALTTAAAEAPSPKTIDGDVSDWTGQITRLGGSALYSKGEYVYQDYLGDAWGGDDGFDYNRLRDQSGTGVGLGTVADLEPRTYRADALQQAAGDQFGVDAPIGAQLHYGDANTKLTDANRYQADVEEVRVAADGNNLYLLARTVSMLPTPATAVLVLVDTAPGGSYSLPPSMGGITTTAEWALLTYGNNVVAARYQGSATSCTGCAVATNPGCASGSPGCAQTSAFTNSIELSVPRSLVGSSTFGLGVATGVIDDALAPGGLKDAAAGDSKSSLVNVAFRSDEPVRIWMDQSQAFAIREGNIDKFLADIDVDKLTSGFTERFDTTPGYYEATYVDATSPVNTEGGDQGIFQHYGVYVPTAYHPNATLPATFWMHYRGGHAHDAAAWLPGVIKQFGEQAGSSPLCELHDPAQLAGCGAFVITPSARGTSTWYTGRGMVDFMDAWNDSHARFAIDANRTYLAGHSMGGWASYLLGLLMPDRWAASDPEDGLLQPALCLGPSGSSGQNGQSADSNLYNILENARNLPYAILHGAVDELVPVTCALAGGARLHALGYRYRNYTFAPYEHYSAPIWDDWHDVVRYMYQYTRDENPSRVVYKTWPFLNNQINTVNGAPGLNFNFNRAYWVSEMVVRTPGIAPSNIGGVDAMTWGRSNRNPVTYPEAGTAAQPEPNLVNGQGWIANDLSATDDGRTANRFTANLTNLSSATFDVSRMGLSTTSLLTASITTDGNTSLVLKGSWASAPTVSGADGSSWDPNTGTVTLTFVGSGSRNITITP